MTRTVGWTDIEAIPTMDLIAELSRREEIAMHLGIQDALGSIGNAKDRRRPSNGGDGDFLRNYVESDEFRKL